jgi:hypothetical protein
VWQYRVCTVSPSAHVVPPVLDRCRSALRATHSYRRRHAVDLGVDLQQFVVEHAS